MDGIRLEINFDDIAKINNFADGVINAGQNHHDLMDAIGNYGVNSTVERFDDQAGPDGQKWQKSGRVIMGQGGKTLWDTGRLRDSISYNAFSDSVEWGTNLIYAAPNQFGATIRPKAGKSLKFKIPGVGFRSASEVILPSRPFVGINDDDETEIGELVKEHYFGGLQ